MNTLCNYTNKQQVLKPHNGWHLHSSWLSRAEKDTSDNQASDRSKSRYEWARTAEKRHSSHLASSGEPVAQRRLLSMIAQDRQREVRCRSCLTREEALGVALTRSVHIVMSNKTGRKRQNLNAHPTAVRYMLLYQGRKHQHQPGKWRSGSASSLQSALDIVNISKDRGSIPRFSNQFFGIFGQPLDDDGFFHPFGHFVSKVDFACA
jgi:hypothetical protein